MGGVEQLGKVLPLIIILILIAMLALIAIFLFQNRKLQMKLSQVLIILSVLMIFVIAYFLYAFSSDCNADITMGYYLFLPLLILVCSMLAYRGIRKDEMLVKSYDRLR
jgi:EamA domain-containing membrane protein RarD